MRSPFKYPPNWLGGIVLGGSPLGTPNDFPVAAGVQVTIFAYMYQQWTTGTGADDLASFVNAYNSVTQNYINWFCGASLPVYTGQSGLAIGGTLDWTALGIYGFERPFLPLGTPMAEGPINTFVMNDPHVPMDGWYVVEPSTFYTATDDIFKRIMTWHLYLGDGKNFSTRWLKRRVMRFLTGVNGTGGANAISSEIIVALDSFGQPVYWPTYYNVDDTSNISFVISGDTATITIHNSSSYPAAPILQAAIASGVCEVPIAYDWTVTLS